jgi:hypothetical protein
MKEEKLLLHIVHRIADAQSALGANRVWSSKRLATAAARLVVKHVGCAAFQALGDQIVAACAEARF